MKQNRVFLLSGLALALLLAAVASYYASSAPDGLVKVATDQGISSQAKPHALDDDSPFSGYGTQGVQNGRLSGGLAGAAGVALTFVLGAGLFLVLRRRDTSAAGSVDPDPSDLPVGAESRPDQDG
jgi:PDGLE domain